jgi:D-arabinose 1-dehydrogenase-like Zn-dependent alcohol dehydrogenase
MSWNRDMSEEFVKFVEAHGIKPLVAKTFGFEEAVEAFELLENGDAVGKVVIKIGDN